MFRTIEQILGLPPSNQFDLAAEPMFSTFTSKPDLTPYAAVPNRIPLNEMDALLAGLQGLQRQLAEFSMTIDSSHPDSAPADTLNRAIWHAVKGFDTPYNYGLPCSAEAADAVAAEARGILGPTVGLSRSGRGRSADLLDDPVCSLLLELDRLRLVDLCDWRARLRHDIAADADRNRGREKSLAGEEPV